MSDILKDLWEGKIAPSRDFGESNEEIELELLCVERQFKCLYSTLSEEGCAKLENLEKHYRNLLTLQREYAFKQGFQLAVKFNKT